MLNKLFKIMYLEIKAPSKKLSRTRLKVGDVIICEGNLLRVFRPDKSGHSRRILFDNHDNKFLSSANPSEVILIIQNFTNLILDFDKSDDLGQDFYNVKKRG